ncbi:MAG TPA: cupin domain-containing protein [Allosphingosinicella sp.]|jgi:quercetin dioxygenase-like cupin family protein
MRDACFAALLLLPVGCVAAPPVQQAAPLPATRPPLILHADSPALDLGEGQARILADGALTGGAWSTLERTEPSGTRTALHRHNRMDEAFYVVRGTFTVYLNDRLHQLAPGAFVFIPRGTPHAQGNSSSEPVKIISFFSPAGWEQSARDRAALHAAHPAGTPGFAERIGAVFEPHDIEILGPSPIPRP